MKVYLFQFLFIFLLLSSCTVQKIDAQKSNNPFIVIIDPGHGGKDPGAIGKVSQEKDLNLSIAKKLGDLITKNHTDVKVVYTRTTDKKMLPKERAEFANLKNADLFISIHANARSDKQVKGTEIYIYGVPAGKEATDVETRENASQGNANGNHNLVINNTYVQNRKLAESIQKAFKKGKRIDLGIRQARFIVLKFTAMPAVLVEVGFISNENEEKYMNSVAGQKAISQAIYDGFTNYKKENGKLTKKQTTESSTQKTTSVQTETKNISSEKGKTYRVQIFLSSKKLSGNSSHFKGLSPIEHYVEQGLYKYTYGNTSDIKEIKKKQTEAKKLFKDAFIVIFENGKRVGIYSEK